MVNCAIVATARIGLVLATQCIAAHHNEIFMDITMHHQWRMYTDALLLHTLLTPGESKPLDFTDTFSIALKAKATVSEVEDNDVAFL